MSIAQAVAQEVGEGAQLQANLSGIIRPAEGPGELLGRTGEEFQQLLKQTVAGYGGLITNFKATASQVSGPVKIVEMGAQLSEQGGSGLILFMALISINLAVLNSWFSSIPSFYGEQNASYIDHVITHQELRMFIWHAATLRQA